MFPCQVQSVIMLFCNLLEPFFCVSGPHNNSRQVQPPHPSVLERGDFSAQVRQAGRRSGDAEPAGWCRC